LLKRQRAIRVFIWIQTLGAAPEQHSQEGKKQPGVLAQRVPAAPCLASSALRRCDASTQCRVPFLLVTQGVQMFRAAPRCSPKRARQGAWCRPCHFRANPRNAVWRALGSQPYGTVALFNILGPQSGVAARSWCTLHDAHCALSCEKWPSARRRVKRQQALGIFAKTPRGSGQLAAKSGVGEG
jgi:hypothetical protein